jgi:hypothetical protein
MFRAPAAMFSAPPSVYNKAMSEKRFEQTGWGASVLALELGFVIGVVAFLIVNAHPGIGRRHEALFVRHTDYQACLNDPACRKKMRLPPAHPRAAPPPRRQLADPFWDRA